MDSILQKDNGIPKYLQLKEILKKNIDDLNYKAGDRFFSEREIMRRYSISSATVSHAMRELVLEGLIERKIGGGSFVCRGHRDLSVTIDIDKKQNSPVLIVSINTQKAGTLKASLLWFISSEIRRGIINTYEGKINIFPRDEYLEYITNNPVQYSILLNPAQPTLKLAEDKGVSFISIDQNHKFNCAVNSVSWDEMEGVYKLMKYLIRDLGHKDIAIISGNHYTHHDRFAAYQIGLRTNGIDYDDKLVIRTDSGTMKDGYQAAQQLIKNKKKPTAIFADTDIKALGVIKAVHDAGLRVPEDISVAGFDDIPDVEQNNPPLTTVRVPYFEMGAEAVRMINKKITKGIDQLDSKILKTDLVVRKTCSRIRGNSQ